MLASLNTPDARKRFAELGLDPVANTPAQATTRRRRDGPWTAVIKAAGIKAE
jgi:hypothetical protein